MGQTTYQLFGRILSITSSGIFTTNLGSMAGGRLTTRAHCGGWLWNGWGISLENSSLDGFTGSSCPFFGGEDWDKHDS